VGIEAIVENADQQRGEVAVMGIVKDELAMVIPTLNQNPKAREIIWVLPSVIAFKLEGEGFCMTIADGQVKLEGLGPEPDIVVSGDASEFLKVITREKDITHVVAGGKVWVSQGKLSKMILFDRMLNLQRRC